MNTSQISVKLFQHENQTDDIEYLRKIAEKSEDLKNDNYKSYRFYTNSSQTNLAYTVGYYKNTPVCISLLQQKTCWQDLGVVGINRRYFSNLKIHDSFAQNNLGLFGEKLTLLQYEHAKKIGFAKFFTSSPRRSLMRTAKIRNARLKALTGEKWYYDQYNRFTILPKTYQYCIWNYQENCFFDKEPIDINDGVSQ